MNRHQHNNPSIGSSLPHHRLHVYRKALELLAAVRAAQVKDAKLRDEALRSAKSVCLNIAEGSGRVTRADKGRAYAIARGECVECIAAVEIAGSAGDASDVAVATVTRITTDWAIGRPSFNTTYDAKIRDCNHSKNP